MSEAEGVWDFTTTVDGYYKIAQGDQCLAMAPGDGLNLSSPNEFGQQPIFVDCASAGNDGNLQKWWVKRTEGGFTLAHAISNLPLVVDGTEIAQQDPNHNQATVFQMVGDGLSTTIGAIDRLLAGQTQRVTVTVRNLALDAVTGATVTADLPEGWTAEPTVAELGTLAGQGEQVLTFRITPSEGVAGAKTVGFTTDWAEGANERTRSVSAPVIFSCAAEVTSPSEVVRFSSQQNDTTERAPAAAVIDGDPLTFWHTQWNGAEPAHPHQIVVGLEETQEICAVTLTPRQGVSSGAANGQIKDYELYATNDAGVAADTTGTPAGIPDGWTLVSEGTLPASQTPQWIPFTETVEAKYILLVSRSAQNSQHPWTTLGEFSVDARAAAEPEPSTTPDPEPEPTTTVTLTHTPEVTVTPTTTVTPTSTVTVTPTTTVTITEPGATTTTTVTATGGPEPTQKPFDVYTTPGRHDHNGRQWFTECEPYSQTVRCRTEIWATQIDVEDGRYVSKTGWVFNKSIR